MKFLRSPAVAAGLAALLLGTTGYCAYNPVPPATSHVSPVFIPPTRLLPEAVVPYPLVDPEAE